MLVLVLLCWDRNALPVWLNLVATVLVVSDIEFWQCSVSSESGVHFYAGAFLVWRPTFIAFKMAQLLPI